MTSHHVFPPTRIHSERRITLNEAADLIADYLARAEDDASLHPTAILTENGPQVTTSTAANTGLVLHNMQRVVAGLRGEKLGPDEIDFDKLGDPLPTEVEDQVADSKKRKNKFAANEHLYSSKGEATTAPVEDDEEGGEEYPQQVVNDEEGMSTAGWQDKGEFEREQDIVQGDVGARDTAAGISEGGQVPKVKRADKADRRAAKKARRLEEKRDREEEIRIAKSHEEEENTPREQEPMSEAEQKSREKHKKKKGHKRKHEK